MEVSNKKIAILGFGIEGQDVLQFLQGKGADITIFDRKEKEALGETLDAQVISGPDYLKAGLTGFDIIFRSPGFNRLLPEILETEKKGAHITSAMQLFLELCPARVIGVTGTKGKGTTATLTYEILKTAGKHVFFAGNIGKPVLTLLPQLTGESWVVLEMGAPQLIDLTISPHISGALNITTDHLDWFGTREKYIETKKPIVRYQKSSDFVVCNADYETSLSFSSLTKAHVYLVSTKREVQGAFAQNNTIYLNVNKKTHIGNIQDLTLRGEHHLENILMALTLATLAGASVDDIKNTIFSFSGLEYRLQYVGNDGKFTYYNDSAATNPDATSAAITAFHEPLTIILGGSDKGLSYDKLAEQIANSENVETCILIGQVRDNIHHALTQSKFAGTILTPEEQTMHECMRLAREHTPKGGVILLSPAAASFGLFKDYKDRGARFNAAAMGI